MNQPSMLTCILTENDCFKAGRKITPAGIVVHSTGANNPYIKRYVQPVSATPDAAALLALLGKNKYHNSWNQSSEAMGRQVCCHAFIGKLADGTPAICQTLPWNHRGWHAGGSANNSYIGFEMCEDGKTDAAYLNTVYELAAQLCAWLCSEYGIKVENVIGHYEAHARGMASNHGDPRNWFKPHDLSMDGFRERVSQLLAGAEPDEQPVAVTPAPAEETVPATENADSFAAGAIVEFTDTASTYTPGGKAIPAWVKDAYYHRITRDEYRGKARVVNGATCVCLGEKRRKTAASSVPFDTGINTWVDVANLRLVAAEADTVDDTEGEGETGADAAAYSSYTVLSGDSLYRISKRLLGSGARYTEIKALNGLTSNIIHTGQTLKIPANT
jgi:N-acetylmuramoyl-L-alanine amidase